MTFNESTQRLLDDRNFATISTLGADGSPHASVMCFRRDGDTLLFSTKASRIKARNITRDPRVSVSVFDLQNPYHSVEIRGTAELTDDPDKTLPKELSHKYLGQDPPRRARGRAARDRPGNPEQGDRIRPVIAGPRTSVVRIIPEKITGFSA